MSLVYFRDQTQAFARLRLGGKDRKRFLHGVVSNDIQSLTPGQGCHAAMLTIKGKLVADLWAYDCGEAGLLLRTVGSAAANLQAALERYLIMDDAVITDAGAELAELALFGEGAAALLSAACGLTLSTSPLPAYGFVVASSGLHVAATPELALPGFVVWGPAAAVATLQAAAVTASALPLSDAHYTALRIAAGTPLYGVDMDEERMPGEAGLESAISYKKGCFLGQEVVVRLRDRGQLNRRLCGLRLSGSGALPPVGTVLTHATRPSAGHLTSVAHSDDWGDLALGYVHRSLWDPGTELQLQTPSGEALSYTATVVELPLTPRPHT